MSAVNACMMVGYVAQASVRGITLDAARSRSRASSTCAASSASMTRCRPATAAIHYTVGSRATARASNMRRSTTR